MSEMREDKIKEVEEKLSRGERVIAHGLKDSPDVHGDGTADYGSLKNVSVANVQEGLDFLLAKSFELGVSGDDCATVAHKVVTKYPAFAPFMQSLGGVVFTVMSAWPSREEMKRMADRAMLVVSMRHRGAKAEQTLDYLRAAFFNNK